MEVAEIMVNYIETTEGQGNGDENLNYGVNKAPQPRTSHQHVTPLATHNVHIMKGLADGHIAVIGHHHKQKDLSNPKEMREEYLSQTAL
jgi:hypothetical protein